jgi:hypothetical protein
VIDQALLTEIQYALLEPPDGGASWPSEIWTREEVLDGLNGAIRQLLRETHLVITRTEIPVLAGAVSVALPDDWIASAELVWRAATNVRTPLGPVDTFGADLALPSWETAPGLPIGYADLDGAVLTMKLVPTPLLAGTVELLYVARPPLVSGAGGILPVPDEFASGLKYNTIGWLLSKVGRLMDPERAAYCDKRYQLTQVAAELILGGWA